MEAFEFRSDIQDGTISVPPEIRQQLAGENIRVILLNEPLPTDAGSPDLECEGRNFISWLMEHPVKFDGPPLKREEIYEERLR